MQWTTQIELISSFVTECTSDSAHFSYVDNELLLQNTVRTSVLLRERTNEENAKDCKMSFVWSLKYEKGSENQFIAKLGLLWPIFFYHLELNEHVDTLAVDPTSLSHNSNMPYVGRCLYYKRL